MSAKNKEKEKPDTGASGKWLRKLSRSLAGEAQDRGELQAYLREAKTRGIIEGDALAMLEGVLGVADIQVRDIMVPRAQMTVLNGNDDGDSLLATVVESGTRVFPSWTKTAKRSSSCLLARLLRLHLATEDAPFRHQEFMRTAVFVPDSKRLTCCCAKCAPARAHGHRADEYGGIAGLVTIEDVIEQIVGDIDDEHDVDEDVNIRKEGDRQYTVRGQTPIDEFNEYFQTELSDEEFDTVAGLVMKQLGRLPRRGETLQLADCEVKVLRFDRRRIDTMRLTAPRDIVPTEDRRFLR